MTSQKCESCGLHQLSGNVRDTDQKNQKAYVAGAKRKSSPMNLTSFVRRKRQVIAMLSVSAIIIAAVACSDGELSQAEVNDLVGTAISDITQISSVETSQGTGAPVVSVSSVGESLPPIRTDGFAQSFSSTSIGDQQNGFWVDGFGSIDVEPDIATLSVGVESRESTVSEAREVAAQALQRVVDAVMAQGVLEDDIQTSSFRISPQQIYKEIRDSNGTYSQPQIIGYIVTNQLSVTIRDLDKVGDVVDSAADEAGDLVRINNISFGVDNPTQYGEQLRQLAAIDAQAKAQIYAETLGVAVGQLIFLSESGSSAPSIAAGTVDFTFADAEFSRAATPIFAGDSTFTARVQAVFAITNP